MGKKLTVKEKALQSLKTKKVAKGRVLPAPKPQSMSMGDFFKSILSVVDDTGKSAGEQILAIQVERAILGDPKSAEFLFDRAYGRPVQTVINAEASAPVNIEHNVISVEEAKSRR